MSGAGPHVASGAVLVTGGSGGIGQAVVKAFAERGERVVVLDRRELPARESDEPGGVTFARCDAADEPAVRRALTQLVGDGGIRHVVGIAGGAVEGEVEAHQAGELPALEVFIGSLRDNLVSQFVILRAALPYVERLEGSRSVTLVSSVNALAGFGLVGYSSAKAGLSGLLNASARLLGERGIRINALAPGTVPTERTSELWPGAGDFYESLRRYSALGRLGTPEQVAEAAVALTTLSHVTGQLLVVDGGQTVHRPL